MGHSFATFQEKHVHAKDFKFEVWLFLFARLISKMSDPPEWLTLAGAEWLQLARLLPNGCVDPELDTYLTDDERREVFLRLCDAGLEELKSFGAAVPASFLNELCESTGDAGFQRDIESSVFSSFGKALRSLVRGEQSEEVVSA